MRDWLRISKDWHTIRGFDFRDKFSTRDMLYVARLFSELHCIQVNIACRHSRMSWFDSHFFLHFLSNAQALLLVADDEVDDDESDGGAEDDDGNDGDDDYAEICCI